MHDEADLIARIRRNDRAAFGAVFDHYYPLIYRYALRHLNHVETAEDIAAQAFQRLLLAVRADNAPADQLKAWLFRVAHNLIVDEVRRFSLRDHDLLSADHIDSAGSVENALDRALLVELTQSALLELNEQQRSVVILRFLLDFSLKETGDILQLSPGAVKATQHRALINLRQILSGESANLEKEETTHG